MKPGMKSKDKSNASVPYDLSFGSVVVTAPLGVLKADKIRFSPPLPDYKTEAIKRLGFGNLNKIVMYFDERFWDDKLDTFGVVSIFLIFKYSKKKKTESLI